jgi:chromate reductase, NAD(P)H dehydrogenase (quinone)
MAKPRIAIIAGSNRRDSINRKLARALAKLGADKFDASFVRIDDLSMFNQDLEATCRKGLCASKVSLPTLMEC